MSGQAQVTHNTGLDDAQEVRRGNTAKIWRCGDPYQYPFPETNGDPWTTVLEPYMKNDKIQCEAWKDEVQNLLIFAGLFSAVVTAFSIESYRTLQPDPNDTIVYLLNRLVEISDNSTRSSGSTLSPPTFTRSASSLRINIFWFLSLVLSLTTVLVGIVSLQWIREHQQYTDQIDSRNSLSVFRMRTLGLQHWYVPQIFTGLPLLLQSALFLFLIGVVDFLYSLDHAVAGWITVAVSLTLLFLIITTALPTFQLFVPHDSKATHPPVQCPYRSPQARIFMVLSSRIYSIILGIDRYIPGRRTIHRHFPARFGLRRDFKSWIVFDSWWRNIREAHKRYRHLRKSDVDPQQDIYNTFPMWPQLPMPTELEAEVLINSLDDYSHDDNVVYALYHCFSEVGRVQSPAQFNLFQEYYIRATGLPYRETYWPSRLMPPFDSSTSRLLHHENMVWFLLSLGRTGHSKRVEKYIVPHLIELKSRITAHTLTACRPIITGVDFLDYGQEHIHYALGKPDGIFLAYNAFDEPKFRYPVESAIYKESLTQSYLILERFIRKTAVIKDPSMLDGTTYNHMIAVKFLDIAGTLLTHDIWTPSSSQAVNVKLHPVLHQTLHFSIQTINRVIAQTTERPLLFLSLSYFLNRILIPYEGPKEHCTSNVYYRTKHLNDEIMPWITSTPILPLLEALIAYYEHFKPTRGSPFSLRQLAYEKIYLWRVQDKPFEHLERYVEIPRDPVLDD